MKSLLFVAIVVIGASSADGWNGAETNNDGSPPEFLPCLWPPGRDQNSSLDTGRLALWPFHHKMPAFLKHVSFLSRWEYYAIIRNPFTTMNEKLRKVNKWAKKQGPEVEKGAEEYFTNIKRYWKDVNKNTTKILEELPKVYPKVYEILSNLDLTYGDMYNKVRDLKLDMTTTVSLYAVVLAVTHTSGAQNPYLTDTAMFFEGAAAPKMENLFYHIDN